MSGDGDKRCLGWGDKEGTCGNAPGSKWGPLWCPECDEQRIAYLSKQFEKLTASFHACRADA